jgi:hypothetical protein
MARLALFVTCATVSLASPTLAIKCNGNFQIVNGEEISTPFCRDNALAAGARESGYRITDAEMRNNASRKEEICRYLRSDIRVHPTCDDVLPDGGGWR